MLKFSDAIACPTQGSIQALLAHVGTGVHGGFAESSFVNVLHQTAEGRFLQLLVFDMVNALAMQQLKIDFSGPYTTYSKPHI